MRRIFCALFVVVMCLTSFGVYAQESPLHTSKYHKLDKATLNKVKQKSAFILLVPENIPNDWTVELKYPYPLDITKPIQSVRLHYFDKKENFMFGIEQHKAMGYKIKKETLDIRNNTRTIVEEDFRFDVSGEIINFGGMEARFTPWANHSIGGFLRWVQEGTYIEMESLELTKEHMIEVAKSVK
ncbi:DUF4367 domain-containing protein [Paenibacillus sepulcri]|uniref:DUF4367 domain-containing protein n=1 Tax=Paenibacillus sepulcri TaxID=359917 RepID=A0ABS7BZE9_9BACL|nr:DUF4367 domain-containing protein [Paenibacillus sepulcri]